MDNLTVFVGQNVEGITFEMPTKVREALKREFPDALPVHLLHVNYGRDFNPQAAQNVIKQYVVPALTGITAENLNRVFRLIFVEPLSRKEIFTIEN